MPLGVHRVAAVDAGDSVPAIERHVRARIVVGPEDLPHERKEVQQPPFQQGGLDGRHAVSFAQQILADVGVRDLVIVTRSVGLQGPGVIGMRLADPLPAELDLKRSQIQVLQADRVGGNCNRPLLEVDRYVVEFSLQRFQVVGDVPRSGDVALALIRGKLGVILIQLADQPPHAIRQVALQAAAGSLPAFAAGPFKPLHVGGHCLPCGVGEHRQGGQSGWPQQMLVDPGGGAERLPPKVNAFGHGVHLRNGQRRGYCSSRKRRCWA